MNGAIHIADKKRFCRTFFERSNILLAVKFVFSLAIRTLSEITHFWCYFQLEVWSLQFEVYSPVWRLVCIRKRERGPSDPLAFAIHDCQSVPVPGLLRIRADFHERSSRIVSGLSQSIFRNPRRCLVRRSSWPGGVVL